MVDELGCSLKEQQWVYTYSRERSWAQQMDTRWERSDCCWVGCLDNATADPTVDQRVDPTVGQLETSETLWVALRVDL
jgi:hypothetical protein